MEDRRVKMLGVSLVTVFVSRCDATNWRNVSDVPVVSRVTGSRRAEHPNVNAEDTNVAAFVKVIALEYNVVQVYFVDLGTNFNCQFIGNTIILIWINIVS